MPSMTDMDVPSTETRNGPLLWTAEETARALRISRSRVFEMLARDELPGVVRIGRSVRISRVALERWVAEQAGDAA